MELQRPGRQRHRGRSHQEDLGRPREDHVHDGRQLRRADPRVHSTSRCAASSSRRPCRSTRRSSRTSAASTDDGRRRSVARTHPRTRSVMQWPGPSPRTSRRSAISRPRSSPPTCRPTRDVRGPLAGVLAGTACATEAFAQIDAALARRVDRRRRCAASCRARSSAPCRGPLAADPHRRAHRAQLPRPPVGDRDAQVARDASTARATASGCGTRARRRPVCVRSRRRPCAPAAGATTGATCRDWVMLKDNHLDGRRHHRGRRAARRTVGPGARSTSSATDSSRCSRRSSAGADAILLDNMTPDEVRECVRAVAERCAGPRRPLLEVSGGVTLENGRGATRRPAPT